MPSCYKEGQLPVAVSQVRELVKTVTEQRLVKTVTDWDSCSTVIGRRTTEAELLQLLRVSEKKKTARLIFVDTKMEDDPVQRFRK
jgi:hypothetical protein